MDIICNKPNLLFLINVRHPNSHTIALTRLKQSLYHKKLIKALTIVETYDNETCMEYIAYGLEHLGKECIKTVYSIVIGDKKLMHREDGPARSCKHCDTWLIGGKIHRDIEPALITYTAPGAYSELWYQHGKAHREKKPAMIRYHNNVPVFEKWLWRGVMHRGFVNGIHMPAYIDRTPDMPCTVTRWYMNGYPHRKSGPAMIKERNGENLEYQWYKHGLLHRDDGPAWYRLSPQRGAIKEWWIDGDLQKAIVGGVTITYDTQLRISDETAAGHLAGYTSGLTRRIVSQTNIKDKQKLAKDKLHLLNEK